MANRSVARWLLGLSAVLAAGLLVLAGRPVVRAQPQPSSAAALHREAIVVDGRVHITNRVYFEGLDPWQVHATGLWDYARAKQGGLAVAVAQVYLQDPPMSSVMRYNYAVKQAVRLIETFHRVLEANPDKMELALSAADVRRIVDRGKMAVIVALEGGFDAGGVPGCLACCFTASAYAWCSLPATTRRMRLWTRGWANENGEASRRTGAR